MTDPLTQADKLINSIGGQINQNTESEQERQATLTERLKIDMNSDNWLAKAIRPLQAAWYAILYAALALVAMVKFGADATIAATIICTTGAIVTSIIGFYFSSRKAEKLMSKQLASSEAIIEKKLSAGIKMEETKVKLEVVKDKQALKIQEREAKVEEKESKQMLRKQKRLDRINIRRAKKGKPPLVLKD